MQLNFPRELEPAYHYCVFAHNGPRTRNCKTCLDDPSGAGFCPSSGISRGIPSSDFLVCLGSAQDPRGNDVQQAGTFMHELGHNLGLCHGGPSDAVSGQCNTNYKPNYLSVMNYLFQHGVLYGSVMAPDGSLRPRTIFDYSRFDSVVIPLISELNEQALLEVNLVDPNGPIANYWTTWYCEDACTQPPSCCRIQHLPVRLSDPIDWNCNSHIEVESVQADINGSSEESDVLTSYNDWQHLQFVGGSIGAGAALFSGLPLETPVQELSRQDAETASPVVMSFLRGDADADGKLGITDPIRLLGYLFLGSPQELECADAADWDDDGVLQINDAIANLGFQFLGQPPAPGSSECGPDSSPDDLGCASFPPCENL